LLQQLEPVQQLLAPPQQQLALQQLLALLQQQQPAPPLQLLLVPPQQLPLQPLIQETGLHRRLWQISKLHCRLNLRLSSPQYQRLCQWMCTNSSYVVAFVFRQ
jgi:hypothetical protein